MFHTMGVSTARAQLWAITQSGGQPVIVCLTMLMLVLATGRTKGKREREGDEGRVKHNFASYCLIRVGSFVGPGEVDGAATSSLKVPVHIYLSLAAETDGTLKER